MYEQQCNSKTLIVHMQGYNVSTFIYFIKGSRETKPDRTVCGENSGFANWSPLWTHLSPGSATLRTSGPGSQLKSYNSICAFGPQSYELTRGTTELALSCKGGVHIGARALLDINLIWFGYIARLSQLGGGGILLIQIITTCIAPLRGGGGGLHSVIWSHMKTTTTWSKPNPDSTVCGENSGFANWSLLWTHLGLGFAA